MERPLETIYMHTAKGKKYFPFAPRVEDVDIEVIAHHLATRARWAGATVHPRDPNRIFYSVAEHSVLVSIYLFEVLKRPDLALAGLLHDASEAYNGDLIRPLKYSKEFRDPFKLVESLNEDAIERHFGIVEQMRDPAVKLADDAVCHTEYLQIVPRTEGEDWDLSWHGTDHVFPDIQIAMLDPAWAKQLFLATYNGITKMVL